MSHNIWKNLELKIVAILLSVVFLLSTILYFIKQNQYYDLMIDFLKEDAVNVHKYAEEVINERSFYDLNTVADQSTWLYNLTYKQMDEIRRIANVLYLYTAKPDVNGEWIYVVDAWDMDDENFIELGVPVSDDDPDGTLVAMLDRTLNDEIVFGDGILDTAWGIVYVTYFPFHDSQGNVIGAIGIDFDCENLLNAVNQARFLTILISAVIAVCFTAISFFLVRGVVNKAESVMTDMEKSVRDAHERTTLMLDTSPLCAHILDEDYNIIDCNEAAVNLYGFKDKQAYIDRFFDECIPDYQPDGHRSTERRAVYIAHAFIEGYSVYDMTFKMPDDDTPMPAEITLVRSEYESKDVVIAYTRDLRDITQMTKKIQHLEKENEKVFYDALTNIHNRRFFDEAVSRVMKSLSRSGGTLSLLMMDIDYFKKYNDTYGHSEGDECLKSIADVLQKSMRPDDFVARYGGEEFVAVLPNTDELGARTVADRLLDNIRMRAIPHHASEAAEIVTVSIGIVTGSVDRTHTADDFIRRADEMLYKSKQNGRNRYSSVQMQK